ncbi:MAG: response regulator [Firmicutes bacterium]|nr:response regulator [Bacillota bacterium]
MNQPAPPPPAIRIVIVGGSLETQADLKYLLERDPMIKVVGCAEHAIAALKLCDKLGPDLVVISLNSPVINGVIGTRLLKSCFRGIKVLLIVKMGERKTLDYALQARADGYLFLPLSTEKIFKVIKNIIFKASKRNEGRS